MKRYFLQMAVCAAVAVVASVTAADTVETSLPGGVTHGYGELVPYNPEGFGTCTFRSEPEGVLCATRTEIIPEGDVFVGEVGDPENTEFAYWTVGGVTQRDENGIAKRQLSFAMPKGNVEAVMVAVSDKTKRLKLFWYGNEQLADTSDTDGDGQTFAQEMALGTSPCFPDVSSGKGVVHGYGELVEYRCPEECGTCTVRSEPEGVLCATHTEVIAAGETVRTEIGDPENTEFAYWTVNGVAQRDESGIAKRELSFAMPKGDVEIVMVAVSDKVKRQKLFWYGTDAIAESSDTDNDGLTFAQEMAQGTSPRFPDVSSGKGVVHGYGELIEVRFGNPPGIPTYGPWGEAEAVQNPNGLSPTTLTDMSVSLGGEPAAEGDVVAVFRGDTGALCGLGKVMDDSGTLTLVCYAPKGVTLSFKVWLSESGVEEAVVVKCDNASKLVAPDVGAFYAGHAISGSTAELIETIVPGEKVTIDTGLVGYTASGLPKGLSYSKTTGKITGSASKPTAAEGAVVKFTKKGFETEELTIVVTAIPKVTVRMEGVNSPGDTDGCKVTGAGAYLVGKKVTLKATVPKGTVFMGWFDDEDVVATQATYSFTMGKENVNLVAKFKKEVMSVGCETLSSKESFPAGVLGAEGGIKLDISTESGVKSVKVDKLPSGMKYDSKSGLITGAPTKAGDNKVVITVTAKSGAVAKKEIEVKVAAMPVMAVGTFTGFVSVDEDNFGTFTLTTTDAGKLTAKVVTAAGSVSFSKTCWDAVEKGVYRAALTTKKGEKLTLTLDSTAGWDVNQLSGEFTTAEIAATKKAAAVPSRTYSVSAQKNAFGKTWYFTAVGNETTGWTLDYAATAKAAALTVTLKADGSTAIAGKLPGLPDKKGKATSFKVSASGCANVGLMREGAITADFASVLTVNKVKKVLAIRTNLWFDRKNDHEGGVGEARFVE